MCGKTACKDDCSAAERSTPRARAGPRPSGAAQLTGRELSFLTMQRQAGNRAVAGLVEGLKGKDEVSVKRAGHGAMQCDPISGKVGIGVVEHCAGDCVKQHEIQHVLDLGPCCGNFKKCLDAGSDIPARNLCREKWLTHSNRMNDYTECNAYNTEAQCLYALMNEQCVVSGGPVSEQCCMTLETEMKQVEKMMGAHCPNALEWPCPFDSTGKILPF